VAGQNNVVADYLSRPNPEINAIIQDLDSVDIEELAREHLRDLAVQRLIYEETHSLQLIKTKLPQSSSDIIVDISQGTYRPVVPPKIA